MYAWFTWFHAAMYFSMQVLVQLSSLLDRDLPGFGTHFSKQFSWSFYPHVSMRCPVRVAKLLVAKGWECKRSGSQDIRGRQAGKTNLDKHSSIGKVALRHHLLHDSFFDRLGIHCIENFGFIGEGSWSRRGGRL